MVFVKKNEINEVKNCLFCLRVFLSTLIFSTLLHNDPAVHQDYFGDAGFEPKKGNCHVFL